MLEQTSANGTYTFSVDGAEIVYSGATWRLTATRFVGADDVIGTNYTIGEVFLERTYTGVDRLSAFHEHIGCTDCDAFWESERRTGIEVLAPLPRITTTIDFSRPKAACELFNVTVNNTAHPPYAVFETGPKPQKI